MNKINEYLQMCQDRENGKTYQDVSLEKHDARFHNGRFNPETMTCKLRDDLEKTDDPDVIPENGGEVGRSIRCLSKRVLDAIRGGRLVKDVVIDNEKYEALLKAESERLGIDGDIDAAGFYNNSDGKIYLSENSVDDETALHEFSHPFLDRLSDSKFSEDRDFFEVGCRLIEESGMLDEMANDPVYGKLSKEEMCKEALVRLMSARAAEGTGDDSLKEWGRGFFKRLGVMFGIENIKADDIAKMSLSDWVDAANAQLYGMQNGDRFFDSLVDSPDILAPDADGALRFNLRTWDSPVLGKDGELLYRSGRDELKAALNQSVADGEMDDETAQGILDSMANAYSICKDFAENGEFKSFSKWSSADVLLDENGQPYYGVKLPNGDYAYNFDFSTVCKKRRPLDAIFAALIERGILKENEMGLIDLDPPTIAKIQNAIAEAGLEVACALCFVDSKRYTVATDTFKFVCGWNGLVDKMRNDPKWWRNRIADIDEKLRSRKKLSFIDRMARLIDLQRMKEQEPMRLAEMVERMSTANNEYSKHARMVLANQNDIAHKITAGSLIDGSHLKEFAAKNPEIYDMFRKNGGAHKAKDSFLDNPWFSDILRPFSHRQNEKGDATIDRDKAYAVGGVRLQSFSDFVPSMVFDYMQMFSELAAKRLPMHVYSKEPSFVKIFGKTGAKINMSLVCKGDGLKRDANGVALKDKDGRPVYDMSDETFPEKEAYRLRDESGNVGTIMVGVSDEHIRAALNDERIDMVIPYHASGINPEVALLRGLEKYEDYTKTQNTKRNDGGKLTADQHFDFYGSLAKTKDPRKTADEYIRFCEKRGLKPKFPQFVYKTGKGKVSKKKGSSFYTDEEGNICDSTGCLLSRSGKRIRETEKNYYKLLADFRLYDSKGAYSPQRDVRVADENGKSVFARSRADIRAALKTHEKAQNDLKNAVGTKSRPGKLIKAIEKEFFNNRASEERTNRAMENLEFDPDNLIDSNGDDAEDCALEILDVGGLLAYLAGN